MRRPHRVLKHVRKRRHARNEKRAQKNLAAALIMVWGATRRRPR